MKKSFNVRVAIFVTTVLFTLFVGVAFAGIYNQPRTATYLALASSFAAFVVLLDIRQDRVLKGFLLIAAGVLYQLVYPRFFYIFVDKPIMTPDLIDHFEIYGQVILLACAGAGGSIIAVYADKTSTDYEPVTTNIPTEKTIIERTVIDNTLHIERLIKTTETLNKKINILTTIAFLIIITAATYTLLL